MKRLNSTDLLKADILLGEITVLNDLIAGEADANVKEELEQERMRLVAELNNIYGTDHIMEGSKIRVINNDFITD